MNTQEYPQHPSAFKCRVLALSPDSKSNLGTVVLLLVAGEGRSKVACIDPPLSLSPAAESSLSIFCSSTNDSSGGKGPSPSTLSPPPPPPPLSPGNFTRGAKKLNGDGGGDKGGEADNDTEVTYFSPAKDVYEGDVIATRVAEEVRSEY